MYKKVHSIRSCLSRSYFSSIFSPAPHGNLMLPDATSSTTGSSALSTQSRTLSALSSTLNLSLSARRSVFPTTTAITSCSPPLMTNQATVSSSMNATPTPPPAGTPQTATSQYQDQKLLQSLMHAAKSSKA